MDFSAFENLRIDVADRVATLTVLRIKALNALNEATLREFHAAVHELSVAVSEGVVAGIIVTGDGEKAFVAGADIAMMSQLERDRGEEFAHLGSDVFAQLEALPVPVIAAVNGFALGGGCELALACDFIYASENARFGQPEVNLGLICGFGGTQRLPRKVGYGPAMELLLTGNVISAHEAARIGLVNRVLPLPELMPSVRQTMATILSKAPQAISRSKQLAQRSYDVPLAQGLDEECRAFGGIFATEDALEGTRAFVEKRPAKFTGR
jgi:enoyl-CoA hydratase